MQLCHCNFLFINAAPSDTEHSVEIVRSATESDPDESHLVKEKTRHCCKFTEFHQLAGGALIVNCNGDILISIFNISNSCCH